MNSAAPLPLSTYFSGHKPVLLALVYYTCPMLCTLVLNGVESSLKAISLDPGRDFEVVAVSFDPHDTPEIAAAKKANYLQRYRRPNTANGWHFLTGDEASIQALTSAVGFRYKLRSGYRPVRACQRHHDSDARRASSRATSTAWNTRRATCAWAWWRLPRTRSARRWTRFCCSVITMIRRPASTAPSP